MTGVQTCALPISELLEIGCGAWRAFFRIEGFNVTIIALDAGFPLRFLHDPQRVGLPDRDAQVAFLEIWPEPPREV